MKNLKIWLRLGIAYVLLLFLFIAASKTNYSSMDKISSTLENFYNHPFKSVNMVWDVKSKLTQIQVNMYKGATEEDEKLTEDYINTAQTELNNLYNLKSELTNIYTGEQNDVTELFSYIEQSEVYKQQIFDCLTKKENSKAISIMNNDYLPLIDKAIEIIEIMETNEDNISIQYVNNANDAKNLSERGLIGNTVFISVVIIIQWILITLSIVKPIREMEKAADAMSKGNLNIDIKYKARDEIGHLAESMRNTINIMNSYISDISNTLQKVSSKDLTKSVNIEYVGDFVHIQEAVINITESYNEMIKKIKFTSEKVATGAEEMAAAAQSLDTGASEQSSAVEQLVATVHNVSEQVDINAKNANNVNSLSANSVIEIEKGNNSMQNLLKAMEQISEQSHQTANIIKVINNIAHQTNLLALNAGIEAARAGDNGLGFAVVATSIGELASECSKAAKNTEELINKTMVAVSNGTNLAGETADVLQKMVSTVNETSTLVEDISDACTRQSNQLKEILQGIQQIAVVVETNSSASAETSASSEELLKQAENLDKMMKEFKVK